jgi:hypothetical protein
MEQNLLDDIFGAADASEDEILNKDAAKGGGNYIDKSGVYLFKINMAKEVPGTTKSDAPRHFVLELESESGAKLNHTIEWYKDAIGGHSSSKGGALPGAGEVGRLNFLLTGQKAMPVMTQAQVKETVWKDNKASETVAMRGVAAEWIGKTINVQVLRIRSNKQIKSNIQKVYDYGDNVGQPIVNKDGQPVFEYVDGPEERFHNEARRFYDAVTMQTYGEKQLGKPAEAIEKDKEYCEKNPVKDNFNTNHKTPADFAGAAPAAQAPATGFGSTGGFGQ